MNKLHKLVNNPFYIENQILHFPEYIIRNYIKNNPNNYFEIGFIYQYYYKKYDLMQRYYKRAININNIINIKNVKPMIYWGYYMYKISTVYDKDYSLLARPYGVVYMTEFEYVYKKYLAYYSCYLLHTMNKYDHFKNYLLLFCKLQCKDSIKELTRFYKKGYY